MDVNEAVARILKIEGVEWVSCFPSNQLIEVAAKEGIRTIMFRQERGAIMAADGYSRLNERRKFGVAITQGGPGSENSMGAIAQSFSDNVPILYIAGGPALDQYAVRPNFSPTRTYQSVSKYGETITNPSQVSSALRAGLPPLSAMDRAPQLHRLRPVKSTHLGYGIPLMIGAKLARPDKFCLTTPLMSDFRGRQGSLQAMIEEVRDRRGRAQGA